eukprot:164110_1
MAHFEETKAIGIWHATITMINTVVGGGISLIATPAGIRHLGILSFILTELFCAVSTAVSLLILVYIGMKKNIYDLDKLMPTTWILQFVNLIVSVNCLGVNVAFLASIHDIINSVTNNKLYKQISLIFVCLIAFILALFVNDTRTMSITSSIASISWLIFIILLGWNSIYIQVNNTPISHDTEENSSFGFAIGISAIVLSWTCQFQILKVYASLIPRIRNKTTIKLIIIIMCVVTFVLYIFEGIFCYVSFGDDIQDDITKNIYNYLPDVTTGVTTFQINKYASIAAIISLGLAQLLTIPAFFIHFAERFVAFIDNWRNRKTIQLHESQVVLNNDNSTIQSDSSNRYHYKLFKLVQVIGIGIAISLVLILNNEEIIIGLIGCICANLISYLIPAVTFFAHKSNVFSNRSLLYYSFYVFSSIALLVWVATTVLGLFAVFS